MFLQEGCESFWDFGLEKPWRAWSLRSCSPGAWKKVQEGTPGGLVCVVSNENVCFPTQRTKIFSLFFSRNLQCLVCILHIQHILPTQPILNCQYPLLTGSHHIEWLEMYQCHWPFQESVYDSGFSRTVLFNLSIPFYFICLFIFATLEAVACSLCSVFT